MRFNKLHEIDDQGFRVASAMAPVESEICNQRLVERLRPPGPP